MGFILIDNGGGDYKLIPEATYVATCVLLADIGTHTESYQGGDPTDKEKLYIGWELNACDSQGKPFFIGTTYNAAFGTKATLRKMLEAWRGKTFTEEELRGFDIRNVLGKSCGLGVFHKPSTTDPTQKNARIGSVQALPKGTPHYEPLTTPWIFGLDNFSKADYDRLPKLAQKVCSNAHEYKALVASGLADNYQAPQDDAPASAFPDDYPDEEIPF